MYLLLMETIGHPHGTLVDCLIADFSKQKYIRHLYITHDLQSVFVTRKKKKMDEPID